MQFLGHAHRHGPGAWRAAGRLGLIFGVLLVALLVGASSASATEPPALSMVSISPASINTTSSSQPVTVTAEITSAVGFANGSVQFESPTGSERTERASLTKVSGTATKGIWEATVTFKQYVAPGTWKVSTLNLEDKEGNKSRLASTELQAKGFAHTVSVTSIEDNEPPTLAGLSFSPSSVNTTASTQTVAVTAHITDNLSGFASGHITFTSPTGNRFTERAFFVKKSGTPTDGMYEAVVAFHRFIAPGPWKVSGLHLEDNVENAVTLNARRLQSKGFPTIVQVESIEDEAPPSLVSLALSPSSVNVTSSTQSVTATAHITDDLSGVASAEITFESPNGKQVTGPAEFSKVSGTETDGMYEATVTFAQFIQSGNWTVRTMKLADNVGNEAVLTSSQLAVKGQPHTVHVESTEDTAPPSLATFSISPATVNVMSGSATATVTAEITDNLSGFEHGSVVFESPNGKVITNIASFQRVSGTATAGVYEAKINFHQFIQPGKWKVSNVNLEDAVGNEVNLSASQLAGKGLPTTIEVESTEDTEPPALAGLSITPTAIDTATSNQIVVVTANITDNLSGFHIGSIQFESENGKHLTSHAPFNAKLSGTETSGTWEAVVNFPESLESGKWKVSTLTLADSAGNEASLTGAQLEGKGFPVAVLDETGAPPTVRKMTPKKGLAAGGTTVTITGTNFVNVKAVKFGSKEAIGFTVMSFDKLSATSPAGTTGTVDVTVTTENGTSAITTRDHFKYEAPTVTDVTPNHGPKAGGTEVTITGTGFEPGSSGTRFKFGMSMATSVSCSSRSMCTAISPSSSKIGVVNVKAIVSGKKSSSNAADRFSYT